VVRTVAALAWLQGGTPATGLSQPHRSLSLPIVAVTDGSLIGFFNQDNIFISIPKEYGLNTDLTLR
jgi:hypothetical protein